MANITLGGTPTHTSGDLPAVGSQAPDFTLTNNDLQNFTLGDLAGKRVVLNIFPSINTGICATSTRHFNQVAAGLENTTVVTVSRDLPFALKQFCGAEGIDNVTTASSFRDNSFEEGYHVSIQDGAFDGLFSRAVVVLDADHKVLYTEQVPEVGQEPNYDAALAAL